VFFADLFLAFGTHNLRITPHHTTTLTHLIVIDLALTMRGGGQRSMEGTGNNINNVITSNINSSGF
jgi:hypothetical protein